MLTRLRSLEQLMPFATAGELLMQKRQSVRDLTGSLIERHERLLRRLHDERAALLFPYPSSY